DHERERKFIERMLREENVQKKFDEVEVLGCIGTRAALTAIASEMRSDMMRGHGMHFRVLIQDKLVEALRLNYPDLPFLESYDYSSYRRIERFCEEEFGVKWTRPSPFEPTRNDANDGNP